jgi:mannosyltransferase OCH1-like enzyme
LHFELIIGIYADPDVLCKKPMMSCIPPHFWDNPSCSVIVGVGIDEPSAPKEVQRHQKWSRNHGFTQWIVVAKPFAEPLKLAIVRAVSHAYSLAQLYGLSDPEQLRSGKGLFDGLSSSYSADNVLEVTGPGMWTDAVLDSINQLAASKHANAANLSQPLVSWSTFTGLQSPRLEGQTLVLPINYFGARQRHSGSADFAPEACVNHMANRSWR